MTDLQVIEIVSNILGDDLDKITPLTGAKYISIKEKENKYLDINTLRVKFDTTNNLLECYTCRKFDGDSVPSSWIQGTHYDEIDGVVYQYLCDENDLPIVDFYSFESILLFALKTD